VQPEIIHRLLDINYQFYQNFAGPFSETRRRIQPGVRKILNRLPPEGNIVDLGCGNGELAIQLSRRGQRGAYLGLDFSLALVKDGREAAEARGKGELSIRFREYNLADPEGLLEAAAEAQPISALLSFATLHHLPGKSLRLEVLRQIARLLRESSQPEPLFIHSSWQFMNSPRLAERVLPWDEIGISSDQVEPGDYLLDWRRGGVGLRYVHLFSVEELLEAAEEAGFDLLASFCSDGESGNLGLYQVWRPR
jgi:SAM-dependent methyltransferase